MINNLRIGQYKFLLILLFPILGCKSNELEHLIESGIIQKSITTRAYTAVNDFENIVPGEPVYDLGYDETMQMDFKWSTIYFDNNDYPGAKESLYIDDQGDLVTDYTYFYNYPFPNDSSLVEWSMISSSSSSKMEFIINDYGVIQGTESYSNNHLMSKEIFQYNTSGQRTKTEVYEEDGLESTIDYKYDTNVFAQELVIEKRIEYFKPNRFAEYYYYTYKLDKLYKSQKYVVQNEKRLTEELKSYTYFDSGSIRTITSREPRSLMQYTRAEENHKYLTKVLTFNRNGDCIRCTLSPDGYKKSNKPKDGENMSKYYSQQTYNKLAFPDAADIECEYEYDNQGEWIKAILTVSPFPPSNKYLIIREISYY